MQTVRTCHPQSDFGQPTQLAAAERGGALVLPDRGIEIGQSLSAGSSTYELALSTGSNGKSLELVRSGDDSTVKQRILSFPDSWKSYSDDSHVSVVESAAREHHLDITINKLAKPFYYAGQQEKESGPILARKHVLAMRPPEITASDLGGGSGIKRSADIMYGASDNYRRRGGGRSKQRRLMQLGEPVVGTEAAMVKGSSTLDELARAASSLSHSSSAGLSLLSLSNQEGLGNCGTAGPDVIGTAPRNEPQWLRASPLGLTRESTPGGPNRPAISLDAIDSKPPAQISRGLDATNRYVHNNCPTCGSPWFCNCATNNH